MIRDERGSASLLGIVFVTILMFLGLAFSFVGGVAVAHRSAQSAADLAALAGAQGVQRGDDGCAAAAGIAGANSASVRDCVVDGEDLRLQVAVDGPSFLGHTFDITARARAGPG